jgi:hypothetical protein
VERYPFGALERATIDHVELTLKLPGWYPSHDQGREGSCVGHAVVLERAITNRAQAKRAGKTDTAAMRRYDPITLWNAAKAVDEWPRTNPGDDNGTSVRAAYDVARADGLSRVKAMTLDASSGRPRAIGGQAVSRAEGVSVTRWAVTVDEIRTAIALGLPVAIGIAWHAGFDVPSTGPGRERWLPLPGPRLGRVRGGHSVVLYGASDKRQAFRLANSWGTRYPLVWLPYATMRALLAVDGEAALVTDR